MPIRTLGPNWPFYNVVFFGVTDTEPFNRVSLVESHDNDGILLDDLIAGMSVRGFAGDFNNDGSVDAADYIVWRHTLGSTFDLNGNGNESGEEPGRCRLADYELWRANFGHHQRRAPHTRVEPACSVPEPASTAAGIVRDRRINVVRSRRRRVVRQLSTMPKRGNRVRRTVLPWSSFWS